MAKFDLGTTGSHPVRISKQRHRLTAVRYNHKPAVNNGDATATLSRSGDDGEYELVIEDGKDGYRYRGHANTTDDTVILLVDEDGNGLTLEMVDASLAYNLSSAPWEKDEHKLAEQYSMLSTNDGSGEELQGDSQSSILDDSDPDQDNPFDYRHYIDTPAPVADAAKSPYHGGASPAAVRTPARSTPTTGPVRRTAKPAAPAQRKAKPRPSAAGSAPKQTAPTSAPEIRVRAASVADTGKERPVSEKITFHFDDSPSSPGEEEELVLDAPPPKPAKHTAHLRAIDGTGPVSLRSAASSPGASPLRPPPVTTPETDDNMPHRQTGDNDSDVEALELTEDNGTKDKAARRSSGITAEDGDDEDAELEAEMMRAMEEADDEDDAGVPEPAKYAEEEEESEEE